MTCRERLAIERPDRIAPNSPGGCYACPCTYGYLERPEYCRDASNKAGERCDECWDREIPEESGHKLIYAHIGEPIAKTEKVDIFEDGSMNVTLKPVIKDSGDRTEFATGAVRDMREGKGRCDLMPLEVVYKYFELVNAQDKVLWWISSFQKNGLSLDLYNAIECFCTVNWACDPATMFLEVAKHFEEGAKKYGENNWQKGIPVHCYIDSAVRHYLKWLRGDKDEPHDRAFVWNLMCCIWEVDYHTLDTEHKFEVDRSTGRVTKIMGVKEKNDD